MISIGLGHYLTLAAIIFFLFKNNPTMPIVNMIAAKVK